MKKFRTAVATILILFLIAGCAQNNSTELSGEDDSTIDIALGESYIYRINESRFSTYTGGKVIAEDKIGEKIEDVSVTAGWWNNTEMVWISQETLRGEVYSIDGISEDVAAALKFMDKGDALTTTHYYVITNPSADLTDVEEYVIQPIFPNRVDD